MPNESNLYLGNYSEGINSFPPPDPSGFVNYANPLNLDIDDDKLIDTVDFLINESRSHFKSVYDLYSRRQKNLEYYLGNEIAVMEKAGKFKPTEARYLDNVIWESEATLKPMALSQVPEVVVTPGNDTTEAHTAARALTKYLNSTLKSRINRVVLSRAYKHRPIYFIGAIKYRWNPEIDDYVFETVHPDNLDIDHNAPDNDIEHIRWLAHHYPLTAKEIVIRFPKKKADFLAKIKAENDIAEDDSLDEKGMDSTYKISEVWFTWYDEKTDPETKEKKWCKYEGVLWKYKDLLLDKMKNPNWDWEGETQLFTYDNDGKMTRISEPKVREAIIGGGQMPGLEQKTIFYNYFRQPEKPFILIGYDQLGRMVYDETSRIEQVIYLQDNINKRGKQITQMGDTAWGKNVFSTESGLKAEDVEQIDMTNPDQDILVKGEVSKVHRHIPGQQPSAALFEEQNSSRNKAFSKMGAHSTTRGERDARETATGRQILREADISKQDDEVNDTISYAAERMSRAALQMIRLRYTDDKLKRILGSDGNTVFETINRDMVDDGMVVEVTASAVQKRRMKEEAFEMAKLQLIDPLTFFEDIEATNPKQRAERLMTLTTNGPMYLEQVVKGRSVDDMAKMVGGSPGETGEAPPATGQAIPAQAALRDIAMLTQGQIPPIPTDLTPGYVNAISDWLQSPEFQQLTPEIQQMAKQFAVTLAQSAQNQAPPQ